MDGYLVTSVGRNMYRVSDRSVARQYETLVR